MNLILLFTYAVSFCFLGYASYQDIKTKEVSNKVWLFYGIVGLLLAAIIYTTQNPFAILFYIINLSITVIIAIVFWEIGVYGGADTKALVCVSFSHATSLLVFAYTGLLMLGANLKKKRENLPLIPFMTLALAVALVQIIVMQMF
jgi:Flp pilus assembly protein protease CpaA